MDVLVDTEKELPQTAKAANTVCFACKSTDAILKWPYLGDPNPATDLKRGANPEAISMAKKYLKNPWVASIATTTCRKAEGGERCPHRGRGRPGGWHLSLR